MFILLKTMYAIYYGKTNKKLKCKDNSRYRSAVK